MSTQNHLANETSPYLQQHSHNPVNWYPWSEEALIQARRENKPILLSIGYAACHWCHVMAHESFEDQETADLMNHWFINIKVDREERPDLDKIYQTTHYMLTHRSGGWPLTVFITPEDLAPFFSGTYFPREGRDKLPAFKNILSKIAEIYRERPTEIATQNERLLEVLDKTYAAELPDVQLDAYAMQKALEHLENVHDHVNGGFGGAPKFPNATILEFLLLQKSEMVLTTLLHMAEGGIYDQLRGGFYRYTVDATWQIPHFEKMLYDNALMLPLFAQAAHIYNEPYFAEIANQTGAWIIAEMQSPEGGYYATLDADSEGHEGKYYVWDKAEIEKLLTGEEFQMTKVYFGLDEEPNFENQTYHLHIVEALNTEQEKKSLASAKQKLLAAREKRPHPHRDEKIITSWNALMIKGMLVAGSSLKNPGFIESANKALHFICEKLWVNNRLLASYKDGKAHLPAYLDDYAYLTDALITAYEINNDEKHLQFATQLAETMLEFFFDEINGGFFFTANDHEKLLYRPKVMLDESVPAGNGVAVRALVRLAQATKDTRYMHAAGKTLRLAWPLVAEYPTEHCALLLGLKDYLQAQ
jgi:uncharacterized protein YyaL (SSP411 family)